MKKQNLKTKKEKISKFQKERKNKFKIKNKETT